MSTSHQAVSTRHPLRTLLLLAVLVGIVVAIKNAIADKGGTYAAPAAPAVVPPPAPDRAAPLAEPRTTAARARTAAAGKVVTAEEIVEAYPKDNLDDFAVPVARPVDGPAGPR